MRGADSAFGHRFIATVFGILAVRAFLAAGSFAIFNFGAVIIEHCAGFYGQDDAHVANDAVAKDDLGSCLETSHDGAVGDHIVLGNPGSLPDDKEFVFTRRSCSFSKYLLHVPDIAGAGTGR